MKKRFLIGLVVAFVAQAGIVGAMVWSRASVLLNGQEIAVRSTFVDPRDIFRGHYVTLVLNVAPIEGTVSGIDAAIDHPGPTWVSLREGADGFWIADAAFTAYPESAEGPVMEANIRSRIRITLPFDRYFADYDRAQELEGLRRDQKLGVLLALDGKGGAVIKGLTIDGARVYDEPIW